MLFSAPYGRYMVTLNELKAVLQVSAQAGQSGVANKTLVESMAQEEKRRKRQISTDTLQTAKNQSQEPQLSSCIQKQH